MRRILFAKKEATLALIHCTYGKKDSSSLDSVTVRGDVMKEDNTPRGNRCQELMKRSNILSGDMRSGAVRKEIIRREALNDKVWRESVVLLHITSLPSPYRSGTVDDEARTFMDFLVVSGQHI